MNNIIDNCIKGFGYFFGGILTIYLFNRIVEYYNHYKSEAKAKNSKIESHGSSIFDREVALRLKKGDEWIKKMEKVLEDAIAKPESKVILIGNMHTEKSQKFEMKVTKEAIKKKIVSIRESCSNSQDNLIEKAKSIGFSESGYFFGMEDPLVNHFSDLVYRYAPLCVAITYPEEVNQITLEKAEEAKISVLTGLYLESSCQKLWKAFILSKDKEKLSEDVLSTINIMLKGKTPSAIWDAYDRLSKNSQLWINLFQVYGTYLLNNHIAKLPKEKCPNIKMIEKYLSNPFDIEALKYIENGLNVLWRGIFIKENIKKTLEFLKIKDIKKVLVIVIGESHYEDVESFLLSTGLVLDSYSFDAFCKND